VPGQPVASGFGILDSVDVILQHDLLRRMVEAHRGQPAVIGQRLGTRPAVDPVMRQQKTLQMLSRLGKHSPRRRARPHL
jgi:hypothetical protein